MVYEIETNILRVLHILSTSGRAQRPSRLDHHIACLVFGVGAKHNLMMFHDVHGRGIVLPI